MRLKRFCTCPHTAKHHKVSGRCKRGCACQASALKARVKKLAVKGKVVCPS